MKTMAWTAVGMNPAGDMFQIVTVQDTRDEVLDVCKEFIASGAGVAYKTFKVHEPKKFIRELSPWIKSQAKVTLSNDDVRTAAHILAKRLLEEMILLRANEMVANGGRIGHLPELAWAGIGIKFDKAETQKFHMVQVVTLKKVFGEALAACEAYKNHVDGGDVYQIFEISNRSKFQKECTEWFMQQTGVNATEANAFIDSIVQVLLMEMLK